jgi:hypothetical protein
MPCDLNLNGYCCPIQSFLNIALHLFELQEITPDGSQEQFLMRNVKGKGKVVPVL